MFQIAPIEGNADLGIPGGMDLPGFIAAVISIFLAVIAVVAVAFIVIGGVWYITSAGDEQQAEKGKKAVIYAVLGLFIVGMSVIIVNFVI